MTTNMIYLKICNDPGEKNWKLLKQSQISGNKYTGIRHGASGYFHLNDSDTSILLIYRIQVEGHSI